MKPRNGPHGFRLARLPDRRIPHFGIWRRVHHFRTRQNVGRRLCRTRSSRVQSGKRECGRKCVGGEEGIDLQVWK
jgi:hypothetical protein